MASEINPERMLSSRSPFGAVGRRVFVDAGQARASSSRHLRSWIGLSKGLLAIVGRPRKGVRFGSVTRVKEAMQAPGSNAGMPLRRLVLLLVCLLIPIRSVGAAVIGVGLDVSAVQASTHTTCIASVASQHALENTDGGISDVQQHGSSLHLDHTCASLCAMAAALPFVAGYRTEPTSPRLACQTPSFQHFLSAPPHEPPRSTA